MIKVNEELNGIYESVALKLLEEYPDATCISISVEPVTIELKMVNKGDDVATVWKFSTDQKSELEIKRTLI
ncbi:MAG: hypothetical protein LBD57_04295 [Endomicrobium sp.]|jgi:hypothetical protein|uniref:hypothetical protein n=1 Tax=Candidatus Endomicrobiellum cubanum TaxID=3242325 RepID=UPI00281E4732|nr:hypothetical protein [Endomicrobium sp.]